MLKKNWNEYTENEKRSILFHAYIYYGKTNDILTELNEYRLLIASNPDEVLKVYIIAKYLNFNPQAAIAKALRENKLQALFDLTRPIDFSKPDINEKLNEFLEDTIYTYNFEATTKSKQGRNR